MNINLHLLNSNQSPICTVGEQVGAAPQRAVGARPGGGRVQGDGVSVGAGDLPTDRHREGGADCHGALHHGVSQAGGTASGVAMCGVHFGALVPFLKFKFHSLISSLIYVLVIKYFVICLGS